MTRTARTDGWRIDVEDESSLGLVVAVHILRSARGLGPVTFRELYQAGLSPIEAWKRPSVFRLAGRRGQTIKRQLEGLTDDQIEEVTERATRQWEASKKLGVYILSYTNSEYPRLLLESNYPVPLLYARGNVELLLKSRTVACVGTRKIRPPYSTLHTEFVRFASAEGFTVVAGFALGADTIGHRVALESNGATVCVMPNGLDRPFPPENKDLWQLVLHSPHGLAVSEFPLGMRASSLSLRKRNKLMVSLSRGVLVSQSAQRGGALNAFRAAMEQRKPVATFQPDNIEIGTGGNRLIAESQRGDITVLPLEGNRVEGYRQWLRKLSSST